MSFKKGTLAVGLCPAGGIKYVHNGLVPGIYRKMTTNTEKKRRRLDL